MLKYLTDIRLAAIFSIAGATALAVSLTVMDSLLLAQAGATVLAASIIYLIIRFARRRSGGVGEEETVDSARSQNMLRFLDILFWGLVASGLLLLTRGVYARPLAFLLIVSAASAVLGVQALLGRGTGYNLAKILVIAVLLRASAYYQYPGTAGYDAFSEINISAQLMVSGHTGAFMGNYEYYPIGHFFTAAAAYLTGLGLRDSYFMLGVAEALSAVFVFLIGRRYFGRRAGLLAALLVAVLDWHVLWGFYIKAMSLDITLLAVVLFLVLAPPAKKSLFFTIVMLGVMALVILTHPFATAVLAALLAAGWLASLFFRNRPSGAFGFQPFGLNLVLLFACATLAYWMYVSGFTKYVSDSIVYALSLDAANLVVATLPTSVAEDIWTRLPTFVPIFFSVIGCLAAFNIRQATGKLLSRAWLAVLCGVMVVLNFVIYYVPQTGPLVRERWFVFVGMLLAVPAAGGLLAVTGRRGAMSAVGVFVLVLVFSGVMTTSYIASPGQVIPFGSASHLAAGQSELSAARSLALVAAAENESIYADHYYSQVFQYDAGVPLENITDFSEIYGDELAGFSGLLVLRMEDLDIASAREEIIMDEARYSSLLTDPQVALVYDCSTVRAFQRR